MGIWIARILGRRRNGNPFSLPKANLGAGLSVVQQGRKNVQVGKKIIKFSLLINENCQDPLASCMFRNNCLSHSNATVFRDPARLNGALSGRPLWGSDSASRVLLVCTWRVSRPASLFRESPRIPATVRGWMRVLQPN